MDPARDAPAVLLPPRFEQWWATVLCLLFAGLGLGIVNGEPEAWIGWLCLLFFGIGGLTLVARGVLRRFFRLELHRDRFVAYHPRRISTVYWADVEDFGVWSHSANTLVGWQLRESVQRRHGLLDRANRALSALDGTLPSLYGMEPDDLVVLLETYRSAAVHGT
ncbi:MAG: hypothetical protein AAF416_07035 [Pseudomonadota bacterium]